MSETVTMNLDRPRELRFGHKAFKMIKSLTGMTLLDIERKLNDGDLDPELIEKMVYVGLRHEDETLTPEKVEDLLDRVPAYIDVVTAVAKAFVVGFAGATEGNAREPEQPEEQWRPAEESAENTTLTKA